MKKNELIELIAQKVDIKDAGRILERIFMGMKESVKREGRFAYPRFGSLVLREHKARIGNHPGTREKIQIKASKTVAFRPASDFKESL